MYCVLHLCCFVDCMVCGWMIKLAFLSLMLLVCTLPYTYTPQCHLKPMYNDYISHVCYLVAVNIFDKYTVERLSVLLGHLMKRNSHRIFYCLLSHDGESGWKWAISKLSTVPSRQATYYLAAVHLVWRTLCMPHQGFSIELSMRLRTQMTFVNPMAEGGGYHDKPQDAEKKGV